MLLISYTFLSYFNYFFIFDGTQLPCSSIIDLAQSFLLSADDSVCSHVPVLACEWTLVTIFKLIDNCYFFHLLLFLSLFIYRQWTPIWGAKEWAKPHFFILSTIAIFLITIWTIIIPALRSKLHLFNCVNYLSDDIHQQFLSTDYT